MDSTLMLVIFFTSIIQSLFGVGVLLFGTPILLLLGYNFSSILLVILPVSISINVLQLYKHMKYVDLVFFKNFLRYSIIPVITFLFIAVQNNLNLTLIVGIFLIFVALSSILEFFNSIIIFFIRHERIYLIIMGIVHGLTNLGGSLLTAIVHKRIKSKENKRATIALTYLTFAVFQLATIVLTRGIKSVDFKTVPILIIIGVSVYILIQRYIYQGINNEKYQVIFSQFLVLIGGMLLLKGIGLI